MVRAKMMSCLSVNHPPQESHITYSLRNCDTEVSSWFEINNILFPHFKNGLGANLSFLGQRALQHPLKDP